jgi:hypothetical protein
VEAPVTVQQPDPRTTKKITLYFAEVEGRLFVDVLDLAGALRFEGQDAFADKIVAGAKQWLREYEASR